MHLDHCYMNGVHLVAYTQLQQKKKNYSHTLSNQQPNNLTYHTTSKQKKLKKNNKSAKAGKSHILLSASQRGLTLYCFAYTYHT